MRSVLLCEGSDDLWFLAYFLHKTAGWNTEKSHGNWGGKLPCIGKQKVSYMKSPKTDNLLAIKSTDGQANIESSVMDILHWNENMPLNPVDNLIIFRDRDNRDDDTLLREMEAWFPDGVILKNHVVSLYQMNEEYEITLRILPLIVPFDEHGAIETLLVQAIAEMGTEGQYIAKQAREYIDDAVNNLSAYLTNQRQVTKAKYAAAMAIYDPTHSRDEFSDLVLSTPWEESASIRLHMENAVKLIDNENG